MKRNTTLLKIHPETPEGKKIQKVIDCLNSGGVIIYPTDTIYGLGCSIYNSTAIEQIARIKNVRPGKYKFSFIFSTISELSEYTKHFDTNVYRLLKKVTPGPFTFILEANNKLPRELKFQRKQLGIRIPDHNVPRQLVEQLGHPLLNSSIRDEDTVLEYITDPSLILERYDGMVDIVIDSGYGDNQASTIIDCTKDDFEILREGKGKLDLFV
jgi:tRNA threonylcarbamoyl adenosine modification protein (Sua5/YciO/YrdC/YwlC family)